MAWGTPSDKRACQLLGQSTGGASYLLCRQLLFRMAQELGQDNCFQCGEVIEDYKSFSIEHKQPWQSDEDPRAAFFDMTNIAFSHRKCNEYAGAASQNARKTHCPQGHAYDEANTLVYNGGRYCRACAAERMRVKRRELISA